MRWWARTALPVLSAAARLAADVGAVTRRLDRPLVLHTAASRVGGLDIGFVPGEGGLGAREMIAAVRASELDLLFLLGADEIDVPDGAASSSISARMAMPARIAPTSSCPAPPTPKNPAPGSTPKGRVQLGNRAAFPPGDAREDWSILRALSGVLGKPLPFDSLAQLRARLYDAIRTWPQSTRSSRREPGDFERLAALGGSLAGAAFASPIRDFYLTNPIARASAVLAECSAMHLGPAAEAAE